MKFCENCGKQLEPNSLFCKECGRPISNNSNANITNQNNVQFNSNGIRCTKCGSDKVNIQMVTTNTLKTKHHGCAYWIFVGWWLEACLWIFLTLPRLLILIFMPKRQKLVSTNEKIALCQNCGNSWNIR